MFFLPFVSLAQPFAYVASLSSSSMAVVNIATNAVVANPVIDGGLTGVSASPNGSLVYITAQSTNQVQVISTASNSVVGAIPVGATPVAVAFTPNSLLAYVVNQASNTVSVIDTGAGKVISNIPVGSRPSGIAVNPAGSRAIVTNNWGTDLSIIDTATNAVIANIPVGSGLSGVAIAPSGAFAYATNQTTNSVSVVSLTSNALLRTISVQNYPNSIAITPNGTRAFVTNGNSSSVSVIDLASNSVIATLGVGENPTAIALTADGSRAEVTNGNSYSVSVIDANSLAVVGSINRIGIYPAGVAVAPAPANSSGPPIPCNYAMSASSQPFPYTGGLGSVAISVPNGAGNCNWTAVSNSSWLSIVSGAAGSGNGVTGFTVTPNSLPQPRTGTITIAGLTFTVSQGPAPQSNQPPTSDSVLPVSGTGSSHTFQLTYSDPAGFSNLTYAFLLINNSLDGAHTCLVAYNRSSNSISLLNDAGSSYLGPIPAGTAGKLSGSQCNVDAGASAASGSGNSLTLNLAIGFAPGYAGQKNSYLLAMNDSGLDSGWQTRGGWMVPSATTNALPTADWITPNADGGSGRTFNTSYSSANGVASIAWTELLFNSSLSAANSCWVIYNRPSNVLYLFDGATGFIGPLTPGITGTAQNAQCILDAGASSVSVSGNSVLVNPNLTFKQSFSGAKNAYMLAVDNAGLYSGWQTLGTYTVR